MLTNIAKVLPKYHKLKIMIIYAKGKIQINHFIMHLIFIRKS